jgi:hypothetical protein
MLSEIGKKFQHIITVEDGCLQGGMGSAVLEWFADKGLTPRVIRIGIPDKFIEHGSVPELYELCHMNTESIVEALEKIKTIEEKGCGNLPVIIAKTQYSLSDNAELLGRPEGFRITVRDIVLKGGAGFIVAIAGKIMLMPGLGAHPAAEKIDLLSDGTIVGLS